MSPAAELRLVGIRTQGDYGCPPAATGDQPRPRGAMKQARLQGINMGINPGHVERSSFVGGTSLAVD